jgi:leader peptidase (prepilin peptidase) / N-methyltransferase
MITHPHVLAAIVSGVFGLAIGSFAGVVADRVPRKESIVRPPSHCTSCEAPLRNWDNIPVVSYLVLRGTCRNCKAKIPPRDLYVELATCASFAAIAARVPTFWAVPAYLILATGLVALSAIDFEHKRLPTPIILVTAGACTVLLVLASWQSHRFGHFIPAAIGAAACFAVFFAIWFISPRAMGFGDVRLAALCGGALGWIGGATVFVGMFAGFVFAVIPSLVMLARGKATGKTQIPFGPFIAMGTVVGVCIGPVVTHIWLHG